MSLFSMMSVRHAILPAVLVATVAATGAMAQEYYPRVIINGENSEIDYGPMGNQNGPVGGGRVAVTGSGENVEIRHLDENYTAAGRDGLKPLNVGSGEGATIVWVPARLPRHLHALVGVDGSLPATSDTTAFANARRTGGR
jgi:hypothetical protein